MNEKKNNGILSIVGLIALLIACVIGVQAMFTALGAMGAEGKAAAGSQTVQADASQSAGGAETPDPAQGAESASQQPAPSFCPFCGEGLPSSFQWGQFCPYCGEQIEA